MRAERMGLAAVALVCAGLIGCSDDRSATTPTFAAAGSGTEVSTWTGPTMLADGSVAPELVAAAQATLADNPTVVAAIGSEFSVESVTPQASGRVATGVVFLVKTPQPVTLPVGTPGWRGTGEGGPVIDELSTEPNGPGSWFYLFLRLDFSVRYVILVPDSIAEHEASTG